MYGDKNSVDRNTMRCSLVIAAILILFVDAHEATTQCNMSNPCTNQLGHGDAFQEPVQLKSSLTSWSVTLNLNITSLRYGWLELKRRLYNGQAAGPTITVKRGDQLSLDLINNLSPKGNNLGRPINHDNHPNSTNLHTHGLHISSRSPQDDVLVTIGPGTHHQYIYQIHESNSPGTYFYHAHLHGCANFQVNGGLSGMLIIEDRPEEMPAELNAVSCPENCDKDIQLHFQPLLLFKGKHGFAVLQHRIKDDDEFRNDRYSVPGGGTLTDWLSSNIYHYTTNGQLQPVLQMKTGQSYRFRMVNGGGYYALELYITDETGKSTSNCKIREIAFDGVYLSSPRKMHDGQTLLVPAAKADWLVKCTIPGTYQVRRREPFNYMISSHPKSINDMSIGDLDRFHGELVTLDVSGEDAKSPFPTTLPFETSHLHDLRSVAQEDIKGRFVVEFNPWGSLNRERWSGGKNYRYKMTLGTLQEWYFLNTDTNHTHALHMHINHFQIISYNAYTGGVSRNERSYWYLSEQEDLNVKCFYQREGLEIDHKNLTSSQMKDRLKYLGHNIRYYQDTGGTLGYSRVGDWKEVMLVPPLSNITVRFIPTDFTGYVVIHCHILGHEDKGMMIVVDIVNPGESLKANVTSGNAYPGTCKRCDRYPFNNPKTLCDAKDGE